MSIARLIEEARHPTTTQRRYTRAFTKLRGLPTYDFSLADLDAATKSRKAQRITRSLSRVSPQPYLKRPQRKNPKSRRTRGTQSRTEHQAQKDLTRSRYLQSSPQEQSRQLRSLQTQSETNRIDSSLPTSVSNWLELVNRSAPQAAETSTSAATAEGFQSITPPDIQIMESSSSLNTSNSAANEETVSTKASTIKHISFMEHLEFRGIVDVPSEDGRLQDFNLDTIINNAPREIEFQKLDNLLTVLELNARVLKRAIRDRSSEDGFPFYDALRQEIIEWRPQAEDFRRFPPMPPKHFDWDRSDCFNSSEATFHRTIMMAIIDRFDCRALFTYSCEEQWKIRPEYLISPTRRSSKITQPKPDLAISFRRSALIDSGLLDFPPELGRCLHPGAKGRERWFPWFFMEAKKDDSSLRDAFEKNLHSASQALFNIYQWMRIFPDLELQFFRDVRVFTIDLNNERIVLRMHRAEKGPADRMYYKYTEVAKVRDYDQFDACHLIKSVLIDYGMTRLHSILKEAFQKVARSGLSSQGGIKRKHDGVQAVPANDGLESLPEGSNIAASQSATTGVSFGVENASLEDLGSTTKRNRPETRRHMRERAHQSSMPAGERRS